MRALLSSLSLLACVQLLGGCRITDAKVDEEIRRRGGVILDPAEQLTLTGDPGMTVSDGQRTLHPPPSIEIAPGITAAACRDRCWETVAREYLDGNPVLDPSRLEDDRRLARARAGRAPDGYFADVTLTNPPGAGANGACDSGKTGTANYFDAPNFPNPDFDSNGVNNSARVYVLEQETCLRCLDPATPGYLGCVKWYYVKVRNDERTRPIVKLVTTGQVHPAPSPNFRAAVDAWNRP